MHPRNLHSQPGKTAQTAFCWETYTDAQEQAVKTYMCTERTRQLE